MPAGAVGEAVLFREEGERAGGFGAVTNVGFHTVHLLFTLFDGSVCSLVFPGPVTLQTGRSSLTTWVMAPYGK